MVHLALKFTNLGFDGLTTNGTAAYPRELGLGDSRVYGPKTFKDFLESGRQSFISFYLG